MTTITKKTLIAFVFTVVFIISYVHCTTITASAPGSGGPADAIGHGIAKHRFCFRLMACNSAGQLGCLVFCQEAEYSYGTCNDRGICCCRDV
ncbi:unnamed protein product [Arabidopsis lyrata]|uniref:Uncharacterized protein n=1 Tax=Arabidopsis lyrata subsp. lyrata TaxID=81972 RepID=D7KVH6_ARALL|nr:hypothetical protein ARALYDRAFT_893339 [Arabidopsis lyrata subsp. lyrata]CAH8256216.1 unnamed protein product [Arabidopsis lyrata]